MTALTKHLNQFIVFAAAMLVAAPLAHAGTISNIASAQWDAGSGSANVRSNAVDIRVEPPPSQPPVIRTFAIDGTGGGRPVDMNGARCHRNGGDIVPASVSTSTAQSGNSARIVDRSDFYAGEPVVVAVDHQASNRDPLRRERLTIHLTQPNGDRETIDLVESSVDSGSFYGMIATVGMPPRVVAGDCRLSVQRGTTIPIAIVADGADGITTTASLNFLVDPFGIVFDSATGEPVSGVRVTLIDLSTGRPATVYGDDGVSAFPNTLITGSTVTDASGAVYAFEAGFYRFPFVDPGRYAIRVEPPAPYTAPSRSLPAALADLRRPDGAPFRLFEASYGQPLTLSDPDPVRVDIPIDRPGTPLMLQKTTRTLVAAPGDVVQYRIDVTNPDARRSTGTIRVTDQLPPQMRLRPATVRLDGRPLPVEAAEDGRGFAADLPALAPGGASVLTYLADVRPDARPGDALNRATASDSRGTGSNVSDAAIRVRRDTLGDRMTIIGHITDGECTTDRRRANGVAGVRVMLQDGSYTVTDRDGRYHFDGVRPGLHVVQIDPTTLPADQHPIDCARNVAAAGSALSRFVEGRGGSLKRADFRTVTGAPRATAAVIAPPRADPLSDPVAAGADIDWAGMAGEGIDWLFPAADHNPRTKAVRVAIRHLATQRVELSLNNSPVDAMTFDGARKSADGRHAVSLWRAVAITDGINRMSARVLDADGTVAATLTRDVHYAQSPMRATLVRDASVLVADGITRPVIAVRLTDRDGRPIKHAMVGEFSVPAPYFPAIEAEADQVRQLGGLDRAAPVWRVSGDNGMAYVELEPTTASGTLSITFPFRDGDVTRSQTMELWLDPGDRPWTVVGFAAGTLGYNTLNDRMEDSAETLDSFNADARLALYAKGRIQGKWLMTLAYDSDKDTSDTRFAGTIDPRAYYTIYADGSDRRFDAASVRKLYLRLERPQFYALFGDYETAINEPQLARYQRAFNGVKAEYRGSGVSANLFAADSATRHRRDEIQGNGLTGPYALGARDILANSEQVRIEVRNRERNERIVETRVLTRHIDYDIDYLAGTLRFREPVLSRSDNGDPQFIVADYEVDGVGGRVLNAGGRVSYANADDTLRVGATLIHDADERVRSNLGGIDARYRHDADTEVRAEVAFSDSTPRGNAAGGTAKMDGVQHAWLVEVEHHGPRYDLLAYVRERSSGFGVGQLNASEDGTRKYGADARLRLSKALSIAASGWAEDYLTRDASRRAARILVEYRGGTTDFRAGLTHADDRLSDGRTNRSTLATIGGSQRLFDRKLELDAQTEFAIGGADASVDFPTRHRFGARLAVARGTSLIASYEIAEGDAIRARTARVGFDVQPWSGAKMLATLNRQAISEYGPRSFAAYGLSQSIPLNDKWTVDVTLDGNRTLGGLRTGDVLNPFDPAATGGFIGTAGLLTEDFLAVTAGAAYRGDRWSATTRAEWRDGELADRMGLTAGVIRQLGEGRALGGLLTWTRAKGEGPVPTTETLAAEVSWAHRPAASRWAWLNKTEVRIDRLRGGIAGAPGPVGGPPLAIGGDALSRRVMNSLSVNLVPEADDDDGNFLESGEYAFFWGTRYSMDRIDADSVKGWSNVVGADVRFDLSSTVALGASGTARIGTGARSVSYAAGPTLTLKPFDNGAVTIGYNFAGFADRDFEAARYSRSGVFLTLKLKFDQTSFAGLGMGERRPGFTSLTR